MELVARETSQTDGSAKFAWRLGDGAVIEAVAFSNSRAPWIQTLRASGDKHTVLHVCISSQVGCNVGCTFCATGRQRSLRGLSSAEILQQVDDVWSNTENRDILGVTFAGMGEPLLNFLEVTKAADTLFTDKRVARVSLSTVGIVPAIHRLARRTPSMKLYISVHATTDQLRQTLIPYNKFFPLGDIIAAGANYAHITNTKVEASYLLLSGVNDTTSDAKQLADLLDPTYFNVQVLMWNDIPGFDFQRTTDSAAESFCNQLNSLGLPSYVMGSKARDIRGGCGQLSRSLNAQGLNEFEPPR